MAKKAPKNRLLSKFSSVRKNPKLVIGGLIILVLIIGLAVLLGTRNNSPTRTSSASELAKSPVNTKNTKEPAASAPTGTSTGPTATSSNGNPTASSPSTSKAAPAASGSSAGSSAASSGGSSTPASNPAGVPFAIDGPPYGQVDPDTADIGCNQSHQFVFTASISATAAGTATYHWEFSDGGTTAPQSLVFTGAGTRHVNTSWNLSSDGTPGMYQVTGWAKAVITAPTETATKASDAGFTMYVSC
jgi:hypothetical protein